RDRLDLYDALGDLRLIQLEELAQRPGVRARDDDLRALRGLAHLDDVRLQPLAVAVRLRRDLLRLRQQRLDLAEVEERVPVRVLLDDPGDDVALAPGELLVG